METIITLETVFKRGEISGHDTEREINLDRIIPTTQGFMLSGRAIQALYDLRSIMNIGSCKEPLPTMGLLVDRL